MKNNIFQDWKANEKNVKGRLVLLAFRLASMISRMPRFIRWIFLPYIVLYRIVIEWLLCIELPWHLRIGPNLRLYHGIALVINDRTIIGANCVLRHSTTIGVSVTSESFEGAAPAIGNNVDIGSNVVILGSITVGDNAVIGAGSVVTKDVPNGAVVVGNPAKILRHIID
jgi:putative colanic acid biosynthesis acetyltransferase WcaB